MDMPRIDQDRACAALAADRELLIDAWEHGSPEIGRLTFPDGPLRIEDLVAHVTMWDEISLAVLTEALNGRAHWSLAPRWETREAGGALNVGGVRAGRLLDGELLRHRFETVRAAHIDTIAAVSAADWSRPLPFSHPGPTPATLAGLCHYVNTPEADPTRTLAFRHAAAHLS